MSVIKVKNSEGVYVEPKTVWVKSGDRYEKAKKVYTNTQESIVLSSQQEKQKYINALEGIRSRIFVQNGAIEGTGNEQYNTLKINEFKKELPVLRLQEEILSTELLAVTQDTSVQNFTIKFQSDFEASKARIENIVNLVNGEYEHFKVFMIIPSQGLVADSKTAIFFKAQDKLSEKIGDYGFTLMGRNYRIFDTRKYTEEQILETINGIKGLLGPTTIDGIRKYGTSYTDSLNSIIQIMENMMSSLSMLKTMGETINTRFYQNLKDTGIFNDKLDELETIFNGTHPEFASSKDYVKKTDWTFKDNDGNDIIQTIPIVNDGVDKNVGQGTETLLSLSKCLINKCLPQDRKEIPDYARYSTLKNWKENNPEYIDNAVTSGDISPTQRDIFNAQYSLEDAIREKNKAIGQLQKAYGELLAILLNQKELTEANITAQIKKTQDVQHTFWVKPIEVIKPVPQTPSNNWNESYEGGGVHSWSPADFFKLETQEIHIISMMEAFVHKTDLLLDIGTDHPNIVSIKEVNKFVHGKDVSLELQIESHSENISYQKDVEKIVSDNLSGINIESDHPNVVYTREVNGNKEVGFVLDVNHPSIIFTFIVNKYTTPITSFIEIDNAHSQYYLMIQQNKDLKGLGLKSIGLFNATLSTNEGYFNGDKTLLNDYIINQESIPTAKNFLLGTTNAIVETPDTDDYIINQDTTVDNEGVKEYHKIKMISSYNCIVETQDKTHPNSNVTYNDYILTQEPTVDNGGIKEYHKIKALGLYNAITESKKINSIASYYNPVVQTTIVDPNFTTDVLETNKTFKPFVVKTNKVNDFNDADIKVKVGARVQELSRVKSLKYRKQHITEALETISEPQYISAQIGAVIQESTVPVHISSSNNYFVRQTDYNVQGSGDDNPEMSYFQKVRRLPIINNPSDNYIVRQTKAMILKSDPLVNKL